MNASVEWSTLAIVAGGSFLAFAVRGLAGFGASLIGIGVLSLLLPPAQVIPAFMALELITSLPQLPDAWRHGDRRSLIWVCLGAALSTPLGMQLLRQLDPNPMRLVVYGCLLGVAWIMLSRWAQRVAAWPLQRRAASAGAGVASGVLNGMAGIGGPPVVIYYYAAFPVAVARGSLIAYLLFIDAYSLLWAAQAGLLAGAAWQMIAVALPFSLLGIWLGQRWYRRLDEARLRRLIWRLLAAMGTLGLALAAWRLA